MDASGTASIVDIDHVADGPERPTRADVERAEDFWEGIGRGEAICVTLYDGGRPSGLFFAGYSFD